MATRRAVTKFEGPTGPRFKPGRPSDEREVAAYPAPNKSQHNSCQFFYRPNVLTVCFE